MYIHKYIIVIFFSLLLLSSCGDSDEQQDDVAVDSTLNQIMAAKTPFALSKSSTPVFTTHEWDFIFGGETGDALKYDNYGEIDELVFVALPGTFFSLQRQIRKQIRAGNETIYYKVTTPAYRGAQELWVDGRFLDLRDVRPLIEEKKVSNAKTLTNLRSYDGLPYTWHGSSEIGVAELLLYYPPTGDISDRTKSDWVLKGFDSLGMLYLASEGQTPVDLASLARFGQPVDADLNSVVVAEGEDANLRKAEFLLTKLEPLDIIQYSDSVWIVLDKGEVIQSKYRSKFDGNVRITLLRDTVYGLMQKATFVKDPFKELENKNAKKFFVRRYAVTENLLEEQLLDAGAGTGTTTEGDTEAAPADTKTVTLTVEEGRGEEGSGTPD